MREILRRFARWIAPTAYGKLEQLDLSAAAISGNTVLPQDLEQRIAELEAQLNELRHDNRRVTELYDLMFARLRDENPLKA